MSSMNLYPALPVLLVDDEPNWLRSMVMSLKVSAGVTNVVQCSDSRDVAALLRDQAFSLVLLDLTMPYLKGQDLLESIVENYPATQVIILTGVNQIEMAIGCMKRGATDFYVKTDERERVIAGVQKALQCYQLREENRILSARMLEDRPDLNPAFEEILTVSPKMFSIFSYLSAVAKSAEPVLVTGESGVGKELIAKALHAASCPTSPLITVNVAGLDDVVFSDTLFGHVKGAYTGADSDRPGLVEGAKDGVLFLDEIGDLSLPSQVKLLRLLQEGEYYPLGSDKPRKAKPRIVAATNQDLAAQEAQGLFRRDLFYRLCAHKLEVPPLRQRKMDLPLLLNHFLTEAAVALGKKRPTMNPALIPLLENYSFPGNVRELRSLVYDAVSVHKGGVLSLHCFKKAFAEKQQFFLVPDLGKAGKTAKITFSEELPTLKETRQLLIAEAMERAKGNQTLAARLLGISHQALSKRLKTTT